MQKNEVAFFLQPKNLLLCRCTKMIESVAEKMARTMLVYCRTVLQFAWVESEQWRINFCFCSGKKKFRFLKRCSWRPMMMNRDQSANNTWRSSRRRGINENKCHNYDWFGGKEIRFGFIASKLVFDSSILIWIHRMRMNFIELPIDWCWKNVFNLINFDSLYKMGIHIS